MTIKTSLGKKEPKMTLPFALSGIEVENFQGINHLKIANIPLDTQWIFLTGENGFGKTSILRAIAKGLVGDEDFVEPLPSKSRIVVQGRHWNAPFSYETRSKILADLDFQIAAYGASRFQYQKEGDKNKRKTHALFSDEAQLINIERILIDADRAKKEGKEKKRNSTFDKLKKIFLTLIPQLADIKIEYIENELITNRYQVRYVEKSDESETYESVKLEDLAAGYRSILTMIGDMIVRLSEHPNNRMDDLQGIVLIDEIDAHLHPKYQYELPHLLSKTFPKIQFIVSTHSPIPILGAKPNKTVVLKVQRSKKMGITVERFDNIIPIHRLTPNALLTSPIFDFQHLFSEDMSMEEILPVDDYREAEKMDEIKKRLLRLQEQGLIQ